MGKLLPRLAIGFVLTVAMTSVDIRPAAAACGGANIPQLFAGAWNGSAYSSTLGVRASIKRTPVTNDTDNCGAGTRYYVATAHANVGPASYIEWGLVVYKNGPSNFSLKVFREVFVNGVYNPDGLFSGETTPACSSLNLSSIRFMAEQSSGFTWYGGYNCSNAESPMSYSNSWNFYPQGTSGYALTEAERFATSTYFTPNQEAWTSLRFWSLGNVLTPWQSIHAWGDSDSNTYINGLSSTSWVQQTGSNPPGYLCTQPSGYANPAPCQ